MNHAEADSEALRMFVVRLEQMQKDGHSWLTIVAVLALLNDCSMLAAKDVWQGDGT